MHLDSVELKIRGQTLNTGPGSEETCTVQVIAPDSEHTAGRGRVMSRTRYYLLSKSSHLISSNYLLLLSPAPVLFSAHPLDVNTGGLMQICPHR